MIEVRPLRFQLTDIPRYWHGERKSVTLFYDQLSVFFPEGERFFVQSVKAHRAFATDDKLKAEVDAFCAQEGHHSREHVRYNEMLTEKGYPIPAMEARVGRILRFASRFLPKRRQLAVTCALEHFTALLGALVLKDPRVLQGAHPEMAALWRWHAGEENEHKAVAFDLFKAAGGTWFERCSTMITVTLSFWLRVVGQQLRLMHAEKILWSATEWWRLFKYLFIEPGGLQSILPMYLSYFRPSFHPNDHDLGPVLEQWKDDLRTTRLQPTSGSVGR